MHTFFKDVILELTTDNLKVIWDWYGGYSEFSKKGAYLLENGLGDIIEGSLNLATAYYATRPIEASNVDNATYEVGSDSEGLGTWRQTNESMSDTSRKFQKFVTGADEGMVYEVDGVKFDGYKNGVLIEAKGNYSGFVNKSTGEFYDWFNGRDSLINQANRQLNVADGTKIEWYFNDSTSMKAVKNLFDGQIDGIELILKPMG